MFRVDGYRNDTPSFVLRQPVGASRRPQLRSTDPPLQPQPVPTGAVRCIRTPRCTEPRCGHGGRRLGVMANAMAQSLFSPGRVADHPGARPLPDGSPRSSRRRDRARLWQGRPDPRQPDSGCCETTAADGEGHRTRASRADSDPQLGATIRHGGTKPAPICPSHAVKTSMIPSAAVWVRRLSGPEATASSP